MADVRALLKAKRQEARINHPLATYSSDNTLRCAACSMVIKHASAWQGHVGSKNHRLNIARLRQQEEEEQRRAEQQEMEVDEPEEVGAKRRRVDDEEDSNSKKQRMEASTSQLPAGFFSDASRSLAMSRADDDDEEEHEESAPAQGIATSAIDEEYLAFQRELLSTESDAPTRQDVYRNATVMAEPEMAPEVPEGFPPRATDASAAPPPVEEPELSEAELLRRKEVEERELIMDRLLEEERAQEEADMKVTMMKAKLEAFKQKRRGRGKNPGDSVS